jgi:LDH2 family malate/lactate/ureidoglycolate dehydrogenase
VTANATVTVTAESLRRFVTALFTRVGMSDTHAATVADVLVWADLRGVASHGVTRVPRYVELVAAGDINPRPAMQVRTDTRAAVLLDADRAAGPVAMTDGMRRAIEKARSAGVGLALVRATTHTAALGYYTLMAAREGVAALALSCSWPNMAYHGSRVAGVSTNPISIAVPGGDRGPVVLDMATGVVALGKLVQARKTGTPLAPGWALDAHGNPTTDPAAAHIPLPLGGPKGAGLSLMIELITSLVVSNPLVAETLEDTALGQRHRQNGFALAVDIARFCDLPTYRREVDRVVAALKRLPRADGAVDILVPGERGARTLAQRERDGIPLPRATVDELAALATRLGVPMFAT